MTLADLGPAIISSPLTALAGALLFGLLSSVSPCTFLRAATLFGLIGKRPDKGHGLKVASMFVAGLLVSYIAIGFVINYTSKFADISRVAYPLTGVMLVLMGLGTAGLLVLPKNRAPKFVYDLRSRLSGGSGMGGSAVLGVSFAFMACPCCFPALLTIFAFTFARGNFAYGTLLVAAFTIAHSLPLLVVGYFGHLTGRLSRFRRFEPYVNFALGVVVFVTGAIVLWIV